MTRNYNNSRREGTRTPSRNYSAGRPGNRRSPRPHRDSTAHEREAGAAPKHVGYRPHSPKGQPSQRQGRNHQPSEHSSAHHGPRSFDTDRRTFDNRRNDGQRGYPAGPDRKGAHSGSRDNEQRPEYRGHNREHTYKQGTSQRGSERFERQPRESQGPDRFSHPSKQNRHTPQRDTPPPHQQSRPPAQRNNSSRRRTGVNEHTGPYQKAQFEGDYEHFNDFDTKPEERHVTRLPDGRVLKGSRPAQRRQARFWTDITDETENLIQPVKTTQAATGKQAQGNPSPKTGTPKTSRKPGTHKASAVAREKKSRRKQATPKPRSTGPKPSQRGFKWPTHKQS